MRRHEGEIIKRTVGALESLLLLHFLGEQKMKDRASAELKIHVNINKASREIGFVESRFHQGKVLAKLLSRSVDEVGNVNYIKK